MAATAFGLRALGLKKGCILVITPTHDRRRCDRTRPLPNRDRLSRDEEYELAARIAAGDRGARNRLVEANLGLVVTIARRFLGRGLDLDDLIGEGNIGLISRSPAGSSGGGWISTISSARAISA
jgi:hypothetical protein